MSFFIENGNRLVAIANITSEDTASVTKANITRIILQDGVYTIGDETFKEFINVTTVTGAVNVGSVGELAFYKCTSLENISLPAATIINNRSFAFCSSLTDINFPEVTSFGDRIFGGCTNLKTVSLPKITTIGDQIFNDCELLTDISMDSLETIPVGAGSVGTTIINFSRAQNLANISFASATTVGNYAFRNCPLLTNVSLPVATTIGDFVFGQCTSLTEISLPSAVTIGTYCFAACVSLKYLNLPNTTSIGIGVIHNIPDLGSNGLIIGEKPELDKRYKSNEEVSQGYKTNEEYNQLEESVNRSPIDLSDDTYSISDVLALVNNILS